MGGAAGWEAGLPDDRRPDSERDAQPKEVALCAGCCSLIPRGAPLPPGSPEGDTPGDMEKERRRMTFLPLGLRFLRPRPPLGSPGPQGRGPCVGSMWRPVLLLHLPCLGLLTFELSTARREEIPPLFLGPF